MKECWEIKKLGDLTTAINGLWVGKKPPFVNIAVIRNTNFTKDCRLDTTDIAYIDAEVKHFTTRKLQCGDIIIEKSGGSDKQPVGRPVIFNIPNGDYSFSNFTSTLRINNQEVILPAFLYKVLFAIYRSGKTASMQSKTTGIRNLDFKSYLNLPIPIPPVQEQEKIVAELDCLSGIIEKKKQQLKELDNLAQSIFYDMLGDPITNEKGWEVKKLGNVCSCKKEIERAAKVFKKDDTILYIDISSIDNSQATLTGTTPFIFRDAPSRAQQKVNKGDVLISLVRPNLKNIAIVHFEDAHLVASSGFCVLRGKLCNPLFIKSLVLTDRFTKYLTERTSGANYPAVREEDIKGCSIGVPPLDLQNEFAHKIETIEKQKELIKKSIVETETLFNSRMDYWFN